jgi:GR25 family glycosyltransferase involved in LPS biosynthesis
MSFYTYLVAWDEVHYNCVEIDEKFKLAKQPITVINSGKMVRSHWKNVGDIRYYRQLHYALKNFDRSYEYMAFMCGDVSYKNWKDVIDRADQVLRTYDNIGLYAPHLTYEPWNENATRIMQSQYDQDLNIASNTDGIFFIMHRDIVEKMLDYFNYLEQDPDFNSMVSGWGVDLIWSAFAINDSKIILRDKAYIVTHPQGSSYNHDKATQEVVKIMQKLNEFALSKNIDIKSINSIINKITGRMSHDSECMNYENFYSKDLHTVKHINDINYHVIHIDDTRKENRDNIDRILKSNKIEIESLNAKNPDKLNKFYEDNKDFKFGWHGFKLGEIGNFGSHYLAWKHLVKSNLENLVVFEDDSLLKDNFVEKYNIAMINTPADFDVLSIYVDPNQYGRFTEETKINKYIATGYQDWSTLCYVVSRQGAEKLLKYVKENGMDYPTDWFIFRRGHEGLYNVYTLTPDFQSPLAIDTRYESQVQ